MYKARYWAILMAVCLLVCGFFAWASGESVIIDYKKPNERIATPADEPIISGAMSPMLGESYTYTVFNTDLVDNVSIRLWEAEHTTGNSYSLYNPIDITLDANHSFQHTFTQEKTYVIIVDFVKNGTPKDCSLWMTSVDRTAELGVKVAQIVQECIQSGASTNYEKAVWLHDWLTHHAYYDYSFTEYGPDGVLLKGYGVCDSYSKAYQILLNEFGIPNHRQEGCRQPSETVIKDIIPGQSKTEFPVTSGHNWRSEMTGKVLKLDIYRGILTSPAWRIEQCRGATRAPAGHRGGDTVRYRLFSYADMR